MQNLDLAGLSNVGSAVPAAGALSSGWFAASGNTKMHFVVTLDATDEDITVTPAQATDASGTATKALNVGRAYRKDGTAALFTKTDVAAATYVIDPGALKGTCIIEIDVSSLDINGAFNHIQLALSGSTTRIQSVVCLPMGGKAK